MSVLSIATLIFLSLWSLIGLTDYFYKNVRIENKLLGIVYISGLFMCISLAAALGEVI